MSYFPRSNLCPPVSNALDPLVCFVWSTWWSPWPSMWPLDSKWRSDTPFSSVRASSSFGVCFCQLATFISSRLWRSKHTIYTTYKITKIFSFKYCTAKSRFYWVSILLIISVFRIATRTQGDLMRTVYPKLVLDGTFAGADPSMQYPMATDGAMNNGRPPLARAVHLTLGVAILGR